MTEYGKGILCIQFLPELVCSRESNTRLLIKKSNYFKGVAEPFNIRQLTDVWRRKWDKKMPHNRSIPARWPGEKGKDFFGPAGEVRRLPWTWNHPLFIFLLVRCLPFFGRSILFSWLPCITLLTFAFLPLPCHHAACLLFFESWLVSCVGAGRSLPQYHDYRVDPAASCNGILPRARVRFGTWHGGGPVIEFFWKSK